MKNIPEYVVPAEDATFFDMFPFVHWARNNNFTEGDLFITFTRNGVKTTKVYWAKVVSDCCSECGLFHTVSLRDYATGYNETLSSHYGPHFCYIE